jgi:hypothetical protein
VTSCFMNSARLLLINCSAVRLLAAEHRLAPNPNDPFATYHQAVDSQISAILEHEPAQRPELRSGFYRTGHSANREQRR